MKKIITTPNAPAPIGPYNQAVLSGNTLYISGQTPIDPSTANLVSGSIEEETLRVMKNLEAILIAAGATFESVVKASIFVKDMHQFKAINGVYAQFFSPETAPARETIEVANLPMFVNVEISMIAIIE
jgi:2-iminobutanoate/2-iminopropanoate deaminase